MRKLVALASALTVSLSASFALACPVCASREEPSSLRWIALGAFIVAPWFVAGAVGLYLRRGFLAERRALQLPTENIE